MNDFLLIGLHGEIDVNDGDALFETCARLLIEDRHDAGCVCPNFIARDVEIFDFSDTLQIGRHLLERIAFGSLDGHAGGVRPCVIIPHAKLTA